jgi:hypothetical protein
MLHEMKVVSFCLAFAGVVRSGSPQPSAGRASPTAPSLAAVDTRPQQPFDARGFYFPTQPLTIKGHRLEWLELSRYHASIKLSSTSSDSEAVYIDCGRATISRDTLEVTCTGDAIGSLRMTGAFLDKKGDFRNRPEISENGAVVLEATVTYRGTGGPQSTLVRYQYSNQASGN